MKLTWFFARRRARSARLEECMDALLLEAATCRTPLGLDIAAFRLQRRMAEYGVMVSFEQAFYRLRKRDRAKVFMR